MKAKESGDKDKMPRPRGRKHQVFTVAGLVALVAATVLALTPEGPRLLTSATVAPQAALVVSDYTCDLSNYGYTGPPVGISVNDSVGALAAATYTPGIGGLFSDSGPVSFATTAATLPASVASQLANLTKITLEATIPVRGAPAASPVAKIWGSATTYALPIGPLTQLEVVNAVDTAFFSRPGIAWLDSPAKSLVFTPYRGGTALPTITCKLVTNPAAAPTPPTEIIVTAAPPPVSATATGTAVPTDAAGTAAATATASATPATVSATPAATGTAAAVAEAAAATALGPVYGCASNYRTTSYRTPLPMTITMSGVPRVGHLLTVTLSSPVTGLAAPAPGLASELKFTGTLPVTGTQAAAVKLNETTADTENPIFTVSGRLRLKKAGTDTISLPHRFVYTIDLGGSKKAVFGCTLATEPATSSAAAAAALTVQVAQ